MIHLVKQNPIQGLPYLHYDSKFFIATDVVDSTACALLDPKQFMIDGSSPFIVKPNPNDLLVIYDNKLKTFDLGYWIDDTQSFLITETNQEIYSKDLYYQYISME
ncbi:hypothetical protein [Moraxella nonliquefaciens]|uniref:Uncharacterized protein n=1 Tax=Moraxella nonliquefaciens TaxID=478 RepID=A0A1B8QT73_MORNO|nr:hypothetical protein [Moraxella nonliquefaciens]OBX88392.1 hypothetical protein A7456_00585 [Moraxella nonliquefaciens]QPT44548.1 hypothetical protein I6G26_11050 [Moraxella nonliquefaciens]QQC29568.1 hypothetical protein I6H63_09830 [Moraxella nonliquefaciens]